MDDPSNPKFEIKWNIKIGDVVKIMRYDHKAYAVAAYGIVIKKEMTNQIYMFPSVDVFLFNTKETKTVPAGSVEVISSA